MGVWSGTRQVSSQPAATAPDLWLCLSPTASAAQRDRLGRLNHGDHLTLGSCRADRAHACPRSRAGTRRTSSRPGHPGDIPATAGVTPGTTPRDRGGDPGNNAQRQPPGTTGVSPGTIPRDKRVPPEPAGSPHPILPHRPIASPGRGGVGGAEPFVRRRRGGHPAVLGSAHQLSSSSSSSDWVRSELQCRHHMAGPECRAGSSAPP